MFQYYTAVQRLIQKAPKKLMPMLKLKTMPMMKLKQMPMVKLKPMLMLKLKPVAARVDATLYSVQYSTYIMAGLCSTRIYLAQEPDLYRFILFLGYSFSIICSNNAIISKFTGHKPTSMPHLMHNLPLWWVSIFPL